MILVFVREITPLRMHDTYRLKTFRRGIMHHKMISSPAVKLVIAYANNIWEYMQGLKVFDSGGVDELNIHCLSDFAL